MQAEHAFERLLICSGLRWDACGASSYEVYGRYYKVIRGFCPTHACGQLPTPRAFTPGLGCVGSETFPKSDLLSASARRESPGNLALSRSAPVCYILTG